MFRKCVRVAAGTGMGVLLLYQNVPASTKPPEGLPDNGMRSQVALTHCQANASVVSVPILENIHLEGVVQGWSGDRCVLRTILKSVDFPEQTADYMTCHYSRETLALLTEPTSNTTNSPSQRQLTKALSQECQFADPALKAVFKD